MATAEQKSSAARIATEVAERCCTGKDRRGNPKAPQRYAIIWQAARLGALAALTEQVSA